jgi:hypothetical protein
MPTDINELSRLVLAEVTPHVGSAGGGSYSFQLAGASGS